MCKGGSLACLPFHLSSRMARTGRLAGHGGDYDVEALVLLILGCKLIFAACATLFFLYLVRLGSVHQVRGPGYLEFLDLSLDQPCPAYSLVTRC